MTHDGDVGCSRRRRMTASADSPERAVQIANAVVGVYPKQSQAEAQARLKRSLIVIAQNRATAAAGEQPRPLAR
jgi:hypothetical protein